MNQLSTSKIHLLATAIFFWVFLAVLHPAKAQGLNQLIASTNPTGVFKTPTVVGNQIFYLSSTTATGEELWVTDGTSAGCHMVKDIFLSTGGSGIQNIRATSNRLFFQANDGIHGNKLWMSDGTEAGTKMVADQSPNGYSLTNYFAVVGNRFVFSATSTSNFRYLYSVDESGTVVQLCPSRIQSYPLLIDLDGRCLFLHDSDSLFIFNTSFTTRTLLATGIRMTSNLNSVYGAVIGGKFYFNGSQNNSDKEPWVTDGTPTGTFLLKDLRPTYSSGPDNFTAFGNKVVFTASGPQGRELYITDGTSANTQIVKNINEQNGGLADASPSSFVVLGDSLFFLATDGFFGDELYVTAGTEASTRRLTDMILGQSGAGITHLTAYQGSLYFRRSTATDTLYQRKNGAILRFQGQGLNYGSEIKVIDNILCVTRTYGISRIFPDNTISSFTNPACNVNSPTLFTVGTRIYGVDAVGHLFYVEQSAMVGNLPIEGGKEAVYRLYPVPASQQLSIRHTDGQKPEQVFVSDMQGRMLGNTAWDSESGMLDVHLLPKGSYQVLAIRNGIKQTLRFVKE